MKLFHREVLCNPVTGEGYMVRYRLIDCKWFGIYLHHFLAPDWSRDPHDHPVRFVSLILSGGYFEEISSRRGVFRTSEHRALSINNIPATRIHRIVYILPNTWTLCFRGPRWRQWGFYTKNGYVPADVYIGKEPFSG